ncbi:MAG: DUF2723 domain-containing protein [Planctomycetia bacterium]|nr:MAG: DUF2723 domain-containing protein [Planctomycetia bacterium]
MAFHFDSAIADPRRAAPRVAVAVGLIALLLFGLTAAPGVCWQDSGMHQFRVLNGLLTNPLGLALSHPLHFHLCKLVTAILPGEPAYLMNLVSALCGAVGVGALCGLVLTLTGSIRAAAFAAAVLALSHTYWQMSAVTETYSLHAALMILEWCVLARLARTGDGAWLVLLFALNGLHVANHMLGTLTLVTYVGAAIVIVQRVRVSALHILAAAIAWGVCTAPYWIIVIEWYQRTGDLAATVHSTFFGGAEGARGYAAEVLNARISLGGLLMSLAYWLYNFPSAAILLALFGVRHIRGGRRPLFWRTIAVQSVLIFAFVMRYSIHDQVTFFVPICAITALWAGLGAERLMRWSDVRGRGRGVRNLLVASILAPIAVYAAFPEAARAAGWLQSKMRQLPFRDSYDHFLRPWRVGDDSAERFAAAALDAAGPGGFVLGNLTVGPMTAYVAQRRDAPTGVRVFSFRESLTIREPSLTDDDLREHLEDGGVVIVAPFADLERYWGEVFIVERSEPFWRLRER